MARSLVVAKEETATTSPLLTGFLFFAVVWLLLGFLGGALAEAGTTPQAQGPGLLNP